MPRYIDADKIEPWFNREDHNTPDERWRPESEFAAIIDNQPTIDVYEEKRGTWEYPFNRDIARCTLCNFFVQDKINNVSSMYQYCPNCRARMDGEK